jgi:hypothetical protein
MAREPRNRPTEAEADEDKKPTDEAAVETEEKTEKGQVKQVDPKLHPKQKKKMYTIIIGERRGDDESQDVFVTDPSDGTAFQIQRGKEVEVPEGVVNNLRESVIEKLDKDRETGEESWRPVARFPFQIIKGPYEKE